MVNNYKLLPALQALLETQNLTQAAQKLNVTQPAMSRTLAQIRAAFSDPILVRNGKGFQLTKRAEMLQEQLPALLRQLDELYQPPEWRLQESSRIFIIAFDTFVSASALPDIARQVALQAPKAGIHGCLWTTGGLTELGRNNIDLVATMAVRVPDQIYGKQLACDQYVVLCDQHSRWNKAPLTIKHYLSARHVQVSGLVDKTREVDTHFSKRRQYRNIFAVFPSFELAAQALIATDHLITVPMHIAARLCLQFPLRLCPLPFELPSHHYYLLWHAKFQHDAQHQWFRTLCFKVLKQDFEQRYQQGHRLMQSPLG